jgi:hypothetical protein
MSKRGTGYSGADSTRPTQPQEGDLQNEGGTAPGGTVAFMGAASQWSTSDPTRQPNVDPVGAAKMQHYGLKDEAPAAKGDVPVHPGLQPGLFRTARDANYQAPDGETPAASGGLYRGESPEVLKQSRGGYRN